MVVCGLEGRFHVYDLRTYHPTKGYSSMSKKICDSTIWGARHSPFNRDIFSILGGDGVLSLFKYNYPAQRTV
jgi:hypothetical protein